MSDEGVRFGEVRTADPLRGDALLTFVGRLHTPWPRVADCPRQGDRDTGPECRLVLDSPWEAALAGIEAFGTLEVLYWLHESRRDLLVQSPRHGPLRGTFALRSPVRPNPIGTAVVSLIRREGSSLVVRGLDCVDGTPLVDLKPDRCGWGGPRLG